MTDPWRLSATEAARLLAARELSSEELVASCLERTAVREPELRAWAHLAPEAALAEARERDREPSAGPLHGLPVGVKDLFDLAAEQKLQGAHPSYWDHATMLELAVLAGDVDLQADGTGVSPHSPMVRRPITS